MKVPRRPHLPQTKEMNLMNKIVTKTMAAEMNEVERDRSRSMSVEDEMMFRMGRPFEDVSDPDLLLAAATRRAALV